MTVQNYDIVVYGASSFVGQIITAYMAEQFQDGSLTWAIAGRSATKLSQLQETLKLGPIEIMLADAADDTALRAICDRTRVLISTVGPYALYGTPLLKACAESGTHYCDLTAEMQWMRDMQDSYGAVAANTGACLVHCCGFDSIPSDLGVYFLQQHAQQQFGKPCTDIKMRVSKLKGGMSGGTAASVVNIAKTAAKDPGLRRAMANPYYLCPPGHGFNARQRSVGVEYDTTTDTWLAPFLMAAINTRVVHQSNALSGGSYGQAFRYEEAMIAGKGKRGKSTARKINWGLTGLVLGASFAPGRALLERFVLPKPGAGPSPEEQANGCYELLFSGSTDTGETINCTVTGDLDPGYGSTAKMLAQAAACLAADIPNDQAGGVWTPATLFGDALLKRLQQYAGLSFKLS